MALVMTDERVRPPRGEVTATDLPVLIGAKERAKWKKAREEDLGLNTRDFAKLAHTTHGTVSNVESGVQPTLKRSAYISYVRAINRKLTDDDAAKIADHEIELTKKLVARIAKATAIFDNVDLEHAAEMLELLAQRKAR